MTVIQHIHQQRKAPRSRSHVHMQLGYIRQQDGVELRGYFQIVVL